MSIEPNDFQSRLSVLLGLQGAVLTDEELSHTTERYPRCRGKEHWAVREYVRRTGVGAREYRAVRDSSSARSSRRTEALRKSCPSRWSGTGPSPGPERCPKSSPRSSRSTLPRRITIIATC